MTGTPIPLSYMIRESQDRMAQCLLKWWSELCEGEGDNGMLRDRWLKTDQIFHQSGGSQSHPNWLFAVKFVHKGFDPALSSFDFGPTRILSDQEAPVPGASYMFDDCGRQEELEFDLASSVTYGQSQETSMSHEIEVDVGVDAKQAVTIGGDATGGKVEAEVSEHFGISDSKAEAKAKSNSTDKTESQDVKGIVAAGHITLATVESPEITSLTPVTMNAVWEASLELSFDASATGGREFHWPQTMIASKRATRDHPYRNTDDWGRWTIAFTDWDDFLEMATGVNTDFPKINQPLGGPGARHALSDPDNRRLQWTGTQHREYQKVADYQFRDVGPDEKQGLIDKLGIDPDHVVTH